MVDLLNVLLFGLLAAVIAYLLGSVSFSIIFTKLFAHKQDIRSMGSGNAGMTNVLRSVGAKAAIFTFIFDFAKGILAVWIGRLLFDWMTTFTVIEGVGAGELVQYGAYIAGFFCAIGHIFPIYFGFKGGKGVLTSWAIIALIDWRAFVLVIVVFIIVFLCSKIVSLASICAEYYGSAGYAGLVASFNGLEEDEALDAGSVLLLPLRDQLAEYTGN